MELTRADYDRALARVPEGKRTEFTASSKRIEMLLNNLLVVKTLAAQARLDGVKPLGNLGDPAHRDRDQALAAAELQRIEADAGKSFDARKDVYLARAHELYTLNREKYRRPEEVRLSDIAVTIQGRGDEAARSRAEEARRRLLGGEDFAAVARQYSDDPTTKDKGGALPFVTREKLTPDYARAVFALSKVGEISMPIKAPAAYHVVRLEERRPARVKTFDEARDEIVQGLRRKYVEDQRNLRIRAIHEDPEIQINQAAIDALVNRIDPKLYDPKAAIRSPADTTPPETTSK